MHHQQLGLSCFCRMFKESLILLYWALNHPQWVERNGRDATTPAPRQPPYQNGVNYNAHQQTPSSAEPEISDDDCYG